MNFVFKSQNGFCPTCIAFGRIWFIQDKEIATNSYSYALFSKNAEPPQEYHFKQKSDLAKFLNDCKKDNAIYDEQTTEYIIGRHTIVEFWERLVIKKKDVLYSFDKNKNTLTEIHEPRQETGFMPYHECLNIAKGILQKMRNKQQMTLKELSFIE